MRIRNFDTSFNRGMATATMVRVLPTLLQAPVLFVSAGVSAALDSSREKAQAFVDACADQNGRSFVTRKMMLAGKIMGLVTEHGLGGLLPEGYSQFPEANELSWNEWFNENFNRRRSRGIESLYNPFFLPQKNSPPPPDRIEKPVSRSLCHLRDYFYQLAVNPHVDSDSRRTALVTFRILEQQVRVLHQKEINLYDAWAGVEAIQAFIRKTFTAGDLYSSDTFSSRNNGTDDSLSRMMQNAAIPALPGMLTPLEMAEKSCHELRRVFYESPVTDVFLVIKKIVLAAACEMLVSALKKSGFELKGNFSIDHLDGGVCGNSRLQAVFQTFRHILQDGENPSFKQLTGRLLKAAGPGLREIDFAGMLGAIGAVIIQIRQTDSTEKMDAADLSQLREMIAAQIHPILFKSRGVFDPNRKPYEVDGGLHDVFYRNFRDIDTALLSFHKFMEDRPRPTSLPVRPDAVISLISEYKNENADLLQERKRLLKMNRPKDERAKIPYDVTHSPKTMYLDFIAEFLNFAEVKYRKMVAEDISPWMRVVRLQANESQKDGNQIYFMDIRSGINSAFTDYSHSLARFRPRSAFPDTDPGRELTARFKRRSEKLREQILSAAFQQAEKEICFAEDTLEKNLALSAMSASPKTVAALSERLKTVGEKLAALQAGSGSFWHKIFGSGRHHSEKLRHQTALHENLQRQLNVESDLAAAETVIFPDEAASVGAVLQDGYDMICDTQLTALLGKVRSEADFVRYEKYIASLKQQRRLLQQHNDLLLRMHRFVSERQKGVYGMFWKLIRWFDSDYQQLRQALDAKGDEISLVFQQDLSVDDRKALLASAGKTQATCRALLDLARQKALHFSPVGRKVQEPVFFREESPASRDFILSTGGLSQFGLYRRESGPALSADSPTAQNTNGITRKSS